MTKGSGDYAKKSAEFKRWLALYFIEKGNWRLTDKAVEEFGTDAIPRQTMEFAEDYSGREREERTEYRIGPTPKEKKKIAYMKVADMIGEGKTEKLYDNGHISSYANWKDKNVRVIVVKKLVEILKKDHRKMVARDFIKNRLSGLLRYYSQSPYAAINETFPDLNIRPWEMPKTPRGFFTEGENRIDAVKWLVKKLKKNPSELIKEDFETNGLDGLIEYYKGSPYAATQEVFPELDIKPWEMSKTPNSFFNDKNNRIATVQWIVEKLKKDPRDITNKDFEAYNIWGVLYHQYNGSPYNAVKEAFPELGIMPWEMAITPLKFFNDKENRIAAIKWLAEKLNKDPIDITVDDFRANRLKGLIEYYKCSPYAAVREAGLVDETDKKYMHRRGSSRHQEIPTSKETLEAAKKLAKNIDNKGGKKEKISRKTFC